MNVITHNERPSLADTVEWSLEPRASINIQGDRLEELLGDHTWFEGSYPCWWVLVDGAHCLIRQAFPEEDSYVPDEHDWVILSDFSTSPIHLYLALMDGSVRVNRAAKLQIGHATKLPLPDRRTA